ncbi:MAG: hypothetical protein H6731_09360 [Myxococcales bacterium]|nr:MAG: hypothetical protein H6731_09360 [Myxococcales bacterium]
MAIGKVIGEPSSVVKEVVDISGSCFENNFSLTKESIFVQDYLSSPRRWGSNKNG